MGYRDRVLLQMAVVEKLLQGKDLEALLPSAEVEGAESVLRSLGISEETLAQLVARRDLALERASEAAKAALERQMLVAAAAKRGIAWDSGDPGEASRTLTEKTVVDAIRDASLAGAELVRGRKARDLGCPSCSQILRKILVPQGADEASCPSCGTGLVDAMLLESAQTEIAPDTASRAAAETSVRRAPSSTKPPGWRAIAGAETGSIAPLESRTEAPQVAEQVPEAIPEKIGPYDVLSVLGRGGMGAVLEARDRKTGARVALKTIQTRLSADDDTRARFAREGKVLALLAHPHVVRFVDRGEADGTTWIAMELVSGQSLARKLEDGRLEVSESARIGRAVAEGLAYAHALGLVHRDVKPGNVLLGTKGEVKLADFGLARRSEESVVLTQKGAVVGTLLYMAPEQLSGLAATPASDLFALGAVLFHCLAGEPPFEGTVQQAFQRVKRKAPSIRTKRPDCPAALEDLVARLLSIDPEQRPGATEVARILSGFEADEPIAPSIDTKITPPARDPRSLSTGARVGPFVVVGRLGSGGMGLVFRAERAKDRKPVALKIVARGLDADASKRFAREARALSEVEHPNVVRFLDAGESDGLGWIAMELVSGKPLDEVVQTSGPLDDAKILDVADSVAAGLAALHAKGIVHRDVKPQNIMVAEDGRVTLVDLGLAKFLTAKTAVTETGTLLGTPYYMSPEQLTGQPVDGRTDLYALGASLYHAATGRRPFDGETTTAVAFQQVHASPPPARSLNPKLSRATAALLSALMEKRRDLRPKDATALREHVARARRGESIDAGKQKIGRLVGAVVVVLALATLFLAHWAQRVASEKDRPTELSLADWRESQTPDTRRAGADTAPAPASKLAAAAADEPRAETRDESRANEAKGGRLPDQKLVVDHLEKSDSLKRVEAKETLDAARKEGEGTAGKPQAANIGAKDDSPAKDSKGDGEPASGYVQEKERERLSAKKPSEAGGAPAPGGPPVRSGADKDAGAGAAHAKQKAIAPLTSHARAALLHKNGLREDRPGRFTRLADEAPMVLVPAGTYTVGPPESPRTVELGAFLIDVEEVSVERWKKFRAVQLRTKTKPHDYCTDGPEGHQHGDGDCAPEKDEKLPARRIAVWDAAAYAKWAHARLPRGYEWEAAARGPEGRSFPWGNDFAQRTERSTGKAVHVESAGDPSWLGLKHLVGNVAEWTLDLTETEAETGVRGASWKAERESDFQLWKKVRGHEADLDDTGFRCVVEWPGELGP